MTFSELTEEQIRDMLNIETDSSSKVKKAQFSPLEPVKVNEEPSNITFLSDIPIELEVELGTATQTLREVLDLKAGSLITLEKLAGDAVDVYANKKRLALGEVVVLNQQFGVRITTFDKDRRISSMQE